MTAADTLVIPEAITWGWFQAETARRWPELPPPPATGCWPEAVAWLRCHHRLPEARALLLGAPGVQAWALYHAARDDLIEQEQQP